MRLLNTFSLHKQSYQRYFVIRTIALITGITFLFYLIILFYPWKIPTDLNTNEIYIERGMSPNEIAALMKQKQIIPTRIGFILAALVMGVSRKLQAGQYHFSGLCNHYKICTHLSQGKVVLKRITFHEGIRAITIASLVHQEFNIDSTSFMALVEDSTYCHSLNIPAISLEGFLYPDTYLFPKNITAEDVIATMTARFHEVFDGSLKFRSTEIQMGIKELITLASIVEGEAVIDSERSTIAALYLNRLRKGMLLQADPTIQYIIPDGPRRLNRMDLQINSMYNTYLHKGLPPGPVNNPGLASIRAVLFPDSIDYLFMVANGDGSHTFSKNISEHLVAKRRFDRIRKYNYH